MTRDPLLAQIHIGKSQLNMADDDYRAMLRRVTGKDSSAKLTRSERISVIDELKRLGFAAKSKSGRHRPASAKGYVRKLYAVWGELKRLGIWRNGDRASLVSFVRDQTGVTDPEWLDYEQAETVIEALKAMKKRGKANV